MFFIAVLIIIFLMWKFFALRAWVLFQTTIMGPITVIIGFCLLNEERFGEASIVILVLGILVCIISLAMYYFTGRSVPPENRKEYYKCVFMYGMVLFVRAMAICLIIGIPLLKWLTGNVNHWHERVLLSGAKIMVDDNLRDIDGNQYREL